MSRSVKVTQTILTMIALALVAALFLGGMVGGQSQDPPASPTKPGTTTPPPIEAGQRMPGVPERPVAEHPTLDELPNQNTDRQFDYEPTTPPRVDFLDGLTGYEAYATQEVTWEVCGEADAQCATVRVPLDWEEPDAAAIEIAVRRVPHGDSSRGPLFVNPGGPGFGGQDMAQRLSGRWQNFDTVGWDPRGTGESTRVVCGSFTETDEYFQLDSSPDDAAEDAELREGAAEFAQQCREGSGELLDHLTTIDVVRDLDLLRHLLGADELNYLGVSYGTYVGATYAQLFPNSVGRFVLDAAVEITEQEPVPQTVGFQRALDNFVDWCAGSDLCALGDSGTEIRADIDTLLTGLDAKPIRVGNRPLTQSNAALGIAAFLYEDDQAYRALAEVIGAALNGNGEGLMLAADSMNGRGQGGYATHAYAFPAMACADSPDEGAAEVLAGWRETFDGAPLMAPHLGTSYVCEFWTADSAPQLELTAADAPPILVVGTTGDSATPYEQAESMARQLESGVLLTLDGPGHGAVTGDNECIARAVDRYLYDGETPEDGTECS